MQFLTDFIQECYEEEGWDNDQLAKVLFGSLKSINITQQGIIALLEVEKLTGNKDKGKIEAYNNVNNNLNIQIDGIMQDLRTLGINEV